MTQKNVALMAIAIGCGLVGAILSQQGKSPPVETVKVLVAAKGLNAGQPFTADNVEKMLKWKEIPRTALPRELKDLVIVKDNNPQAEKELLHSMAGKQITRRIHEDEPINNADMGSCAFIPGMDTMSMSMSAKDAAGGRVGPGSKVDILAALTDTDHQRVFTLLPDVYVLAVNGIQERKGPAVYADMQNVSFAVTKQQAILLTLAKTRNCKLELLLRHPDDAPRTDWKYDDTEKLLTASKKVIEVQRENPQLTIFPEYLWMPKKESAKADLKRRMKEVAIHTPTGTTICRYEEVRPDSDEWKMKETVTPTGGKPPTKHAPMPTTKQPTTDGVN